MINPEEKTNILSARLLQLNTEYTKAQADRVSKEAAYNSVKSGTLDAAQASTQGEALKKLTESSERGAAEIRRGEESLRRQPSRVSRSAGASRRDPDADRGHARQHRAARGDRISRSR